MKFWLGVVQRAHVLHGVELGIAQTNHGRKAGIARMRPGDGLLYYSPRTDYPDGDALKEFTAIGVVVDSEPWQAEEHDFRPWRRRIDYDPSAQPTAIEPLLDVLDLTRDNRNWGYQLRRGQLEVTEHDFRIVAEAMGADIV